MYWTCTYCILTYLWIVFIILFNAPSVLCFLLTKLERAGQGLEWGVRENSTMDAEFRGAPNSRITGGGITSRTCVFRAEHVDTTCRSTELNTTQAMCPGLRVHTAVDKWAGNLANVHDPRQKHSCLQVFMLTPHHWTRQWEPSDLPTTQHSCIVKKKHS